MATKPVKHFHSAMVGAPALSGTAGSLVAVLDACLINGFNLLTLDSLVVSGNVITGTKAGHGYVVNQVLLTAGAAQSELNGEWTVTSVTSNTWSAGAPGVANVTGTGTISVKAAPAAGWSKEFTGTNKAVYKSTVVGATACRLRVDDSGTTVARVTGYETMSDVDTGVGPFPTAAQLSGGAYWLKSNTADATARPWVLIGDGTLFYFSRFHNASPCISIDAFGDYPSEKQGDAYRCLLTGCLNSNSLTATSPWFLTSSTNYAAGVMLCWSPRSQTQIGSSISLAAPVFSFGGIIAYSGAGSNPLPYPSPLSNGLILGTLALREGVNYRCLKLPGLYGTPQALPLTHLDVVAGIGELAGNKLLAVQVENSTQSGRLFFDITGPWS